MDSCAQHGIAVFREKYGVLFLVVSNSPAVPCLSDIDFIALSFIDNYFGAGQFMILIDRFHCVQI